MKSRTKKLLACGMSATIMLASLSGVGITFVDSQVFAEKLAQNEQVHGRFAVSDKIVDHEAKTVTWELDLSKIGGEAAVEKQLLLAVETTSEVLYLEDEQGTRFIPRGDGRYQLDQRDTLSSEKQIKLVTAFTTEEQQTVLFKPEVSVAVTELPTGRLETEAEPVAKSYPIGPVTGYSETVAIAQAGGSTEEAPVEMTETPEIPETPEAPESTDDQGLTSSRNELVKTVYDAEVSTWAALQAAMEAVPANEQATITLAADATFSTSANQITTNPGVTIEVVAKDEAAKSLSIGGTTNLKPITMGTGSTLVFRQINFKVATGTTLNNAVISVEDGEVHFEKCGLEANGRRRLVYSTAVTNPVKVTIQACDFNGSTRVQSLFNIQEVSFTGTGTTYLRSPDNSLALFEQMKKVRFADGARVSAVAGGSQGNIKDHFFSMGDKADQQVVFEGEARVELDAAHIGTLSNTTRSPKFKPLFGTANQLQFISTDPTKTVEVAIDKGIFSRVSAGTNGKVTYTDCNITFDMNTDTVLTGYAKALPKVRVIEGKNALIENSEMRTRGSGYTFNLYFTEEDFSDFAIEGSKLAFDGLKSSVTNGLSSLPSYIHFYGNEDNSSYYHKASHLRISASDIDLKGVSYNNQTDGSANLYRTGLILHEHGRLPNETAASSLIVDNGSSVKVYNPETSGIATRGTGMKVIVKGGSLVEVTGGSKVAAGMNTNDANKYMAAVRMFGTPSYYLAKGEYEFEITGASTFRAVKLQNDAEGNRRSAALRIGGQKNSVKVSEESTFELLNGGNIDESSEVPTGNGDYIALQYDNIPDGDEYAASFEVGTAGSEDFSRINIDSKSGMGIFGAGVPSGATKSQNPVLKVAAHPGADFIVRGHTKDAGGTDDYGVFGLEGSGSKFMLAMETPDYYEFENYNIYGSLVKAGSEDSYFDVKNAFTMLWKNHDDPPLHKDRATYMLGRRDYRLTGKTFELATINEFAKGINQYSYICARGTVVPKLVNFYQPTNADQRFYGQLVVAKRDGSGNVEIDSNNQVVYDTPTAAQGQAGVFLEYTVRKADGSNELRQSFVKTAPLTDPVNWGITDIQQQANFMLALPAGEYLQAGTEVKVIGSWDAGNGKPEPTLAELQENNYFESEADVSDTHQVLDVLAPEVTADQLTLLDDVTTTTIQAPEAKQVYLVDENHQLIAEGTTTNGSDWHFTDLDILGERKLYVYAVDDTRFDPAKESAKMLGELPQGKIFDQADQLVQDKWRPAGAAADQEGNMTLDHGVNSPYRDVVRLPEALLLTIQPSNKLPELQIKDDQGQFGLAAAQTVEDYQDVTFQLSGQDPDSGDYIRELQIMDANGVIHRIAYGSGAWGSPQTLTLPAALLDELGVYGDYGTADQPQRILRMMVISTNGDASGSLHDQSSNEVTLTLTIQRVRKFIEVPTLLYGTHSIDSVLPQQVLDPEASQHRVVVRNSLKDVDWTVSVTNVPDWNDGALKNLQPLMYYDQNHGTKTKQRLDGNRVNLLTGLAKTGEDADKKGAQVMYASAISDYSFTSDWHLGTTKGLFFEVPESIKTGHFTGDIQLDLTSAP